MLKHFLVTLLLIPHLFGINENIDFTSFLQGKSPDGHKYREFQTYIDQFTRDQLLYDPSIRSKIINLYSKATFINAKNLITFSLSNKGIIIDQLIYNENQKITSKNTENSKPQAYISKISHGQSAGQKGYGRYVVAYLNFDKKNTGIYLEKFKELLKKDLGIKLKSLTSEIKDRIQSLRVETTLSDKDFIAMVDKINNSQELNEFHLQELETESQKASEQEKKAKAAADEAKQKELEMQAKKEAEEKAKLEAIRPQAQNMLHQAILKNSSDDIAYALKAGASIDMGVGNQPPLLFAILLGKTDAVESLISAGASIDIEYQEKPISLYAISKGDLKTTLALIKNGAKFNGIVGDSNLDAFNYIFTHFNTVTPGKTERIDFDVLQAIADHGYDLEANFKNYDLTKNAWFIAINKDMANHILFLLNKHPGFNLPLTADINQIFVMPDKTTVTPLLLGLKNFYLKRGPSATAFHTVLRYGPDVNKKASPDIDTQQQSPLSYAILNNNYGHQVQYLIQHSASLEEAYEIFIQNGGSPNQVITLQSGTATLLGLAIHYQNVNAIKTLLKYNVDLSLDINPYPTITSKNKPSSDPFESLRGPHKPLYFAIQSGNSEIIDLLMRNGAQI